ncbi:MAG: hypothetical protein DI629_15370 [Mesorhizobium amorphae]|nr:MAG: hypothetical protein DI629_15370 [Mesorhizobium amorphae]
MRSSVSGANSRFLLKGAALLLLCGAATGCSSASSRFGGGLDSIFTASTPPAQTQTANAAPPITAAPAGTVTRTAMAAPPAVSRGSLEPVDQTQTASLAPAAPAVPAAPAKVASAEGGKVMVESGDTINGLARRHGVTPAALMAANGITDQNGLKSGRTIVIPGTKLASAAGSLRAPVESPLKAPVPTKPEPQKVVAALEKPAAPAAAKPGTYTVQSGDSINTIARKAGVTADALKAANGLGSSPLQVGQSLTLPKAGAAPVAVAKADKPAPATASEKPQVASYAPPKQPTKSVQDVADDGAEAPGATGIGKMRWPVRGRVVSNFGSGGSKSGDGIDIAVPEGTPVKAAENGVVIYAGDGLKEFGNTVLVRHEDGLVTVYGHASELKVTRGQKVARGQQIATSGMSGSTDSPKLHFEVRKNSAPVNPSTYLE